MRTIPQLCINGTIEAAELYKEAFGIAFGLTVKHDDGTYAHLSLVHGNTELFSMTERNKILEAEHLQGTSLQYSAKLDANESPLVSVGLYGLTKEAVWNAYNVLKKDAKFFDSEGPKSLPWLELDFHIIDKFGVSWEAET